MEQIRLKEKNRNFLFLLLSFLIPAGIMVLVTALTHFYPFDSENSLLKGDAGIEYYPILLLVRRVILSGESLLYTFRSCFGTPLLPLIAYFCVSPFNIPFLFLPEEMLPLYMTVTVWVRIGLAGLSFSLLLRAFQPRLNALSAAFAAMYALNAWLLTNFWQTVWLDDFALLPLIMLGLVRLVRDKKPLLYPLALGLAIACNYYLAFILCCAAGLFWLCLHIVLKSSFRDFLKGVFSFLGLSVIAAGFSAILLVPTVFALTQTTAASDSLGSLTETYGTLMQQAGQLVSFSQFWINAHPANISCGMLVIVLFGGFLTAKRISLRERFCTLFCVLFLMASLWYAPLNYVWHGLHYPHITVDRFAFLVPFTLCFAGWRFLNFGFPAEDEKRSWGRAVLSFFAMAAVSAGILFCAFAAESTDIIFVSAGLAGFYLLFVIGYYVRPDFRPVLRVLTLLFAAAELGYSGWLGVSNFHEDVTLPELTTDSDAASLVSQAAQEAQAGRRIMITEKNISSSFNIDMRYDLPYGGSSQFSSNLPESLSAYAQLLGMQSYRSAYYLKSRTLTPFAMSMLGLQYTVSRDPVIGAEELNTAGEWTLSRMNDSEAFGFLIPDDVPADDETLPVFERQNRLFAALTGLEGDLLKKVTPDDVQLNHMTSEALPDGGFSFESDEPEITPEESQAGKRAKMPEFLYSFTAEEAGDYFLSVHFGGDAFAFFSNFVVQSGEDELLHRQGLNLYVNSTELYPLGRLEENQEISAYLLLMAGASGTVQIDLVRFDEALWTEGEALLHAEPLTLTKFSGAEISGTVSASEDRLLYLSIPYEPGWTAEVDGQAVSPVRALDAMTGVPVSAGEHTVTLRFRPRGLEIGFIISCAAAGLYLLMIPVYFIVRHVRKKRGEQEYVCEH